MARLSAKRRFWRSKLSRQLKFLSSIFVENTGWRDFGPFEQSALDRVIPAWTAGIRLTWMFPAASLRIRMPAIHAGMTKSAFDCLWVSISCDVTAQGRVAEASMDPATQSAAITALAAVAGSIVGGLASFLTTFFTQRNQAHRDLLSREVAHRE